MIKTVEQKNHDELIERLDRIANALDSLVRKQPSYVNLDVPRTALNAVSYRLSEPIVNDRRGE